MSVETPAAPTDSAPAAETTTPAPEAPVVETPAVETPAPESQPTEQPETDATPAPADPRSEINTFAESVGINPEALARFPDLASAQAAVQFMVESTAQAGLSGVSANQFDPQPAPPASPVQTTVAPQNGPGSAETVPAVDLAALGLDANDPAAKVIQQLESRLAQTDQTTQQLQQQFQQQQEAQQQAARQQLTAQAGEIVSGFGSPKYGTNGSRTAAQEFAVQQLFDLADAIMLGHHRAGRPLPSLEARLAQARMIHEGDAPSVANGSQQPALPAAQPSPAGPSKPLGLTDQWSKDPDIRRALGI